MERIGDSTRAAEYFMLSIQSDVSNADASFALFMQAKRMEVNGKSNKAIEYLLFIRQHSQAYTLEVLFILGLAHTSLGDIETAAQFYSEALEHDPLHSNARINLASLHHYHGSIERAIIEYRLGLFFLGQYRYEIRRKASFPGETGGSGFILPQESMLRLNMAAAFMQLGRYDRARHHLLTFMEDVTAVEDAVCAKASLPWISANTKHGIRQFEDSSLEAEIGQIATEMSDMGDHPTLVLDPSELRVTCDGLRMEMMSAVSHILHIERATCDWKEREVLENFLLRETLQAYQNWPGKVTGMLPFDSLLVPFVSLEDRRRLAEGHVQSRVLSNPVETAAVAHNAQIRLGFLGYDFNNHPTAHLVEAVFDVIRKQRKRQEQGERVSAIYQNVHTVIYSYGKDDSSDYRQRLVQLADQFKDVISATYDEAVATIRADAVDVLLDLQVHTLGNRLEIPAKLPAPIQANYLVYPATSGAPFLGSLIVDRVVVPPEHARHYSERLLMLVPSYQISYYERHNTPALQDALALITASKDSWTAVRAMKRRLRATYGLPSETFVFCNFNKADKLDQITLNVWLSIMRQVPGSVLWLLNASVRPDDDLYTEAQNEMSRGRIRRAAVSAGISPQRIVFASRVSKTEHLVRHLAADLFLDSMVYGAHSTATDALRAALPVLTVTGGSFPSRVGTSLYESLYKAQIQTSDDAVVCGHFMLASVKDFELSAIQLARSQTSLLQHMSRLLARAVLNEQGIFNTVGSTEVFLRGMEALKEARAMGVPAVKEPAAQTDMHANKAQKNFHIFMEEK